MPRVVELPAFAFPVIAWAPEPASGDPTDDATRGFIGTREVVTTYFPESDLRLAWTFVDADGYCWQAVSSRVTGQEWWGRVLPRWLGSPRYWLTLDFEERPHMPFEAVKSRLHLAVTANPKFYRGDSRQRRKELDAATSLRDLIKTDEARAIERLEPVSLWRQWWAWEGRCSRRLFVIATVAFIAGESWLFTAYQIVPFPVWLTAVWAGLAFMISAVVRRLHDVRRAGWWTLTWTAFTLMCAMTYGRGDNGVVGDVAAHAWQIVTLGGLGLLAIWPGTHGPNRYGDAPMWIRR